MSNNIDKQLNELRELQKMDFLDDDARNLIKESIDAVERIESNASDYSAGKLQIKFKNDSPYKSPVYAKEGDSGFDLRANIKNPFILKPLSRGLVPTGLTFEFPLGYDLKIRPNNGTLKKKWCYCVRLPR